MIEEDEKFEVIHNKVFHNYCVNEVKFCDVCSEVCESHALRKLSCRLSWAGDFFSKKSGTTKSVYHAVLVHPK